MKSFKAYFITDSFSFLLWETPHTQICGILTYRAGYTRRECPLLLPSVLKDQPQIQGVVTMLARRNDLKNKTNLYYIPELVIVKTFFTIAK